MAKADEPWTQLATRIPKELHRRLRLYRVTHDIFIDLPEEMRRVMARQAEAERERRAKVIAAEGEYQAAQRLADASAIMAKEPIALQLRFLQTLVEIASENNSTTIFPVPIDLLKPFLSAKGDRTA
jgi:regulator of protease activity HflC (stomatin/prohibitin superfamily)